MKIIGLIGGIGPESTVDYYQRLISGYQARTGDDMYPRIVINSIELSRVVKLVSADRLDELADVLAREIQRLGDAGAEIGALTANTAHIVFDKLVSRAPIPLVSIVEAACNAARARGFRRLALLGTRFTMSGRFFPEAFSHAGIELVVPSAAEQDAIHEKYMGELVRGVFLDATRASFVKLIETLRDEQKVEGVVLAGTELPLLLRDEVIEGIPFLDTTVIHVEAILDGAMS